MVERIRDGRGIILLEGREVSDAPLQLRFSYDGTELFTYDMELTLSNVEDMYRHLDLRSEAMGGSNSPYSIGTRLSEPTGWPEGIDGPANDKHFILLHGFRVDGDGARGTFAELFKRMYHSGSNARFTGVTWYGNDPVNLDYWEAVIRAFQTSEALADTINNNSAFEGSSRVIAAHSLGNMVVSSAIKDHGLVVNTYYMFDAAVAKEAYDSLFNAGEQNLMRNPNWDHSSDGYYDWRLMASHWHLLFKDCGSAFGATLYERSSLTWRGRFGIINQAYNFFSSTEDVLKASNGSNPSTASIVLSGGERAWVAQKMNKGLDNLNTFLNNDSQGGWGFNYTQASYPNGWRTPAVLPYYRILSPSEYSALDLSGTERDEALRNMPFFRQFMSSDSDYSEYDVSGVYEDLGSGSLGGTDDAKYITRSKILAEAIPSLSHATGSQELSALGTSRNIDMYSDLQNGWPSYRPDDDWLHGDYKDIAYQYVYPLYDKFVELGNLDE